MKRFTIKRITALVLALVMTLSLLPMTAWAEGATEDGIKTNEYTITNETDASLPYTVNTVYNNYDNGVWNAVDGGPEAGSEISSHVAFVGFNIDYFVIETAAAGTISIAPNGSTDEVTFKLVQLVNGAWVEVPAMDEYVWEVDADGIYFVGALTGYNEVTGESTAEYLPSITATFSTVGGETEPEYVPLYWSDDGGMTYHNGIDEPYEQPLNNHGYMAPLYVKAGGSYVAIDKQTFGNDAITKLSEDIGFFGWLVNGENIETIIWNTESAVEGEESGVVFTVGDVQYLIKLKILVSTTEEAAATFASSYLFSKAEQAYYTTATFDNAVHLSSGKDPFDAMTSERQEAVLKIVPNAADLLAAGRFILWGLHGNKYGGQHLIEITDETSDRDIDEFIGAYDRLWNTMTGVQQTMVNDALTAIGGRYTVDEMYTVAKAEQAESGGSSSTFGDPYTIEVVPLGVDDVIEKLTHNGTFNFSKENPNLDSIEKIWAFYKGVDEGDGFLVICNALANKYGTADYGTSTDPLTAEQGFNRVYHTGAFIAGHLSTIENPVYRWEHLVASVEAGTLAHALMLAQTKFAHDTMLSSGQKMLLKTYLETSMEEGYATAISLIKRSTTDDVVSAYMHRFLWDYKEQELIIPDNVMLIRGYDTAYGGGADNPWNVIGGEEIYSTVLSDEQRAAVNALYEEYDCTYPELLRLAQAYHIAHLDKNISAENALAIVKSTEIGDLLIKLINNALIYGRPVQLAISAVVAENMNADDKDALNNAVPNGYEVENYQELGVTVTVDGQTTDVTQTDGKVTVNVGKAEKGKEYKMVRKHGNKVDVLPVVVDEDGNLIVESDQFSSYALVSTSGSGDNRVFSRGVFVFDGKNGTDLSCSNAVQQWGNSTGEFVYVNTSGKIYLAANQWDTLSVNNGATLSQVGQWNTTVDGNAWTCNVYEMTVPGNSNIADYTVTRAWEYWGDHDNDPDTADQLISKSEYFTLTVDGSPVFDHGDYCMNCGVGMFNELTSSTLVCGDAVRGQPGSASVDSFGKTSQKMYLTSFVNQDIIVYDEANQAVSLMQVGVTYFDVNNGTETRAAKVYEMTAVPPSSGNEHVYKVETSYGESFDLTFDFSPVYNDDGNQIFGARGVFLFTDKNGNEFSCDSSSVMQWGNPSGEYMYLTCGDVASRTVYLAVNKWDNLSVSGVATLPKVGTWVTTFTDENGEPFQQTCNVYELTVGKPATGKTVDCTVTRSWTWHDDNNVAHDESEDFTLTFDFAAKLTGDIIYAERGVMLFTDLSSTTLGYDKDVYITGYDGAADISILNKNTQTMYLGFAVHNEFAVKNGGQNVNMTYVGIWSNSEWDNNLYRIYKVDVNKPTDGSSVVYDVTNAWWNWENGVPSKHEEPVPLTFEFTTKYTNSGNVQGAMGVVAFTDMVGNDLTCDNSVLTWGNSDGEYMYIACGDVVSRTVYLAVNKWDNLSVSGVATLPKVGTWVATFTDENGDSFQQTCNVYELTVDKPATGNIVEYTVTRSWTWYDEENDREVNSAEDFTLTFDFAPVLKGELRNMECGVAIFSDLTNGVLGYDAQVNGYGGFAEVLAPGESSQTVYLTSFADRELTVSGNAALKQVGVWYMEGGNGRIFPAKVYEMTVLKPAISTVAQYTVKASYAPDDYEIFDLAVDFSPLLSGDIVWGNWDVALFTEKNGDDLSCNAPIAQWWDTLYVACDSVASKTVYLTIAPYSDFSLTPDNGGAAIHKSDMVHVGKWKDEWGNLKDVYALTVQNPYNASMTTSYDAVRSWSWYDDKGNNNPEDDEIVNECMEFTLTFDFAPMLTGEPWIGNSNVFTFSNLSADGVLSGDDSLIGAPFGQTIASGGTDEKTIYLAVYANKALSVKDCATLNPVFLERVGTWTITNDEGGFENPYKVYKMTVENPGAMGDIVKFFVTGEWEWCAGDLNENGKIDDTNTNDPESGDEVIEYIDSFPLTFDFYLAPGDMAPLYVNGLRIYSFCNDEGHLGYMDPANYDEMAYNATMGTVQVPGRPNQNKSIYLVSQKALTLSDNEFGATLNVCEDASVPAGYTVYCLTVPAKDNGAAGVKVTDGTSTTAFNIWFDSVVFQRTSFYTTEDFSYKNRVTCDGLSIEWLNIGEGSHFALNVPYTVGKDKELYIIPNDGDIVAVEVTGGGFANGCQLQQAIEGNAYKLTLPESDGTGNIILTLYKTDADNNMYEYDYIDILFVPQMEVTPDDSSITEAEKVVGDAIVENIDELILDGSVKMTVDYVKEDVVQLQQENKLELVPEHSLGCDEEEKELIDEAIIAAGGTASGTDVQYFDISVALKHVETGKTVANVTNTKAPITITIDLNDMMQEAARAGKFLCVVRVHNGVTTFIDAVLNETKTKLSFESAEFCSYAVAALDEEPSGVTVSGTVTSYLSDTADVTIELFANGSTTADYTASVKGNSATYSIEGVVAGTYTMKVSKANHVTREYTVVVSDADVTQDAKICPKGDADCNGKVNIRDWNAVKAHNNETTLLTGYEFACADTDGNGKVNIRDWNALKAHINETKFLW